MSLRGIRKAYNDYPEYQVQSLLNANHGEVPLYRVRHPRPTQAVAWEGEGEWFRLERIMTFGAGKIGVGLLFERCPDNKKPRSGLILNDGKAHEVCVRVGDRHLWTRQKLDAEVMVRNAKGVWAVNTKTLLDIINKRWYGREPVTGAMMDVAIDNFNKKDEQAKEDAKTGGRVPPPRPSS